MNLTQKRRGRPVTHEEALASARRLINSHFHNGNQARCSIPAQPEDDDLIITDYILEQTNKVGALDAIKLESKGTYALQLKEEISDADMESLYDQLHDIHRINGINFVVLPRFAQLVTKEQA